MKGCPICVASEELTVGRMARVFVAGMRYARLEEGESVFPRICSTHLRQVQEAEVDASIAAVKRRTRKRTTHPKDRA